MLINVSRFVDVQNQLRNVVSEFFEDVISDLENYSKLKYDEAMRYQTIRILKAIWDEYNLSDIAECEWAHILKTHMYEANQSVKIRSINQKSVEKLDYDDEKANPNGLRVIAVGGNCLSRGLTLEDLVVSYFYRNSQTYDTLMQMGRWFGYRPGYANLVKLWISKDAASWYRHISEASEELKLEIIRMNRNNLKPIDFGLKIKGHPDVLIPTARNKMRNASLDQRFLEVDIAGKLIESPRLRNNHTELLENKSLLIDFIGRLDNCGRKDDNELLWRGLKAEIVAELVGRFKSLNWHWYFDAATLSDYIRDCGEIWDVSIQQGSGVKSLSVNSGHATQPVRLQSRKIELLNNKINISGTKVRVGKGQCARTGLDPADAKVLADRFKSEFPDRKNVPDSIYLHTDRNPILFIHFLECNDESSPELKTISFEIAALGLGFVSRVNYDPNYKPRKVKVYLNKIAAEIDMNIEEGDDENVD